MESNPDFEQLSVLLDELEGEDPEHNSVAVSHESGWTISAFPSGRMVLENVEELSDPRHRFERSRAAILRMFREIAEGHLETVEAEGWGAGYGPNAS
jgi:hypothetical protein